jgi:hypothetical protein
MKSSPIMSLELQTQWRLPHVDSETGRLEFFDGFGDWAWWVWDCLELFSEIKTLKVTYVWRANVDGLQFLESLLKIDIASFPKLTGYRSENVAEPGKWRFATSDEVATLSKGAGGNGRIFLVGLKERKGRTVQIECTAVSKADLAQYSERSYGWSSRRLGRSWLPDSS